MPQSTVVILAKREWRSALKSRWFWFYAAALAVLAGGMFGLAASTIPSGLPGQVVGGRILLTMINLIALLIPLMGLTAGVQSLALERDRRTLSYLLAQPVTRSQVLVGKWLGNAMALGFAVAGAMTVLLFTVWWLYLPLPFSYIFSIGCLAWLLSMATLSLGMGLGARAPGQAAAQGYLLGAWLLMVIVADLGIMGATFVNKLSLPSLVGLSLLNPVHQFRVATVAVFRPSMDLLGPAGQYLYDRLHASMIPVLVICLLAWTCGVLLIAIERFRTSRVV